MSESVLCVSAVDFERIGRFSGFAESWAEYLPLITARGRQMFIPRGIAEQDESFLQLIPYVLFVHRPSGKVFSYSRSKQQGEKRLHGKRSVGVGGHVNKQDAGKGSPYERGLEREIREEVDVVPGLKGLQIRGLLHDPSNAVGRVHLGVVHVLFVEHENDVIAREDSMLDSGFFTLEWLAERGDDLETWSQLCVAKLQREASE